MELKKELTQIAKKAKCASAELASLPSSAKNEALKKMAAALVSQQGAILKANKRDLLHARASGLSQASLERLMLNEKRIQAMSDALLAISGLPDPVGELIKEWRRPNGLLIKKVRVPIGVIAIIYESRPNVTADCVGLCFKSGNSVILRGGSESLHSNRCIFQALRQVLLDSGITADAIAMVPAVGHQGVEVLLKLDRYIDLVMPRGGEGLIKQVIRSSRIPVIKHYKGICHVYVDEYADLNMAQAICANAKLQRPGVCNAMESMLVHKDVAIRFLPGMLRQFKDAGVEIRGCPLTQKIVKGVLRATDKDYHTEYLDLILSVKVVETIKEAIAHINHYGTHHSDSIVTDSDEHALLFLRQVDSACVYVNASTRFTDGSEFGMGAEIGISTDKLHARGPMALEELTTYKYMVIGNGQVRR